MPAATPKWELDAREQIKAGIRKYQKPLQRLVDSNANESDTRLLVTDFLCDALGYDKYENLATEKEARGNFVDYAIEFDKKTKTYIEVKRVTQDLNARHLRQVETYVRDDGLEWAILTNGRIWQVYHLDFGRGQQASTSLVFEADLLGPETPATKVEHLFHIHKAALKRDTVKEVWRQRSGTEPAALASLLLSAPILESLRKEVRREYNFNPETSKIKHALKYKVIRDELLNSDN